MCELESITLCCEPGCDELRVGFFYCADHLAPSGGAPRDPAKADFLPLLTASVEAARAGQIPSGIAHLGCL